jgi:hypothetical protein
MEAWWNIPAAPHIESLRSPLQKTVTTMSLRSKIASAALIALFARTMSSRAREALDAFTAERHAKPAVSVPSDFGVAPSFPGLR